MKALIAFGESAEDVEPVCLRCNERTSEIVGRGMPIVCARRTTGPMTPCQAATALDHVGECEDKAFHDDWYDRNGIVLYESFAMDYQRAD